MQKRSTTPTAEDTFRARTGRFWKPGATFPGIDTITSDKETEREGGLSFVYNQNVNLSISQQRQQLPIYKYRKEILYILEKYRVLIIIGETGCGKTTQIPQYLFEEGWCSPHGDKNKCIACTQPRRISAITVAKRVSEERETILGSQVGYAIQFDNRTDEEKTKIKYMTDGMLLREMMLDPLLSSYSVIMVDEAHERSFYTDLLLGLLKKIMGKRQDLRVIVSSATIDAELFKDYFETNIDRNDKSKDTAYILSIPGRTYPVQLYHSLEPVSNYLEASVKTVLQIHQQEDISNGDLLVFLTGQEEIENFIDMLNNEISTLSSTGRNKLDSDTIRAYPLYSGLPMDQQIRVFEENDYIIEGVQKYRKVIAATNVAETSVTIPSITYVVDSGFVKQRVYNPRTESEMLVITEISKASAQQRAGRAGRVRSGKCYRLYTRKDYDNLRDGNIPEIQRSNLTGLILYLKALGIDDIALFPFISAPPSENMIHALELLYAVGALDESGKLIHPIGFQMAEFPVEPQIAKMLLISGKMGCSEEVVTIAAMLSVQNIFVIVRGNEQTRADVAKRKFAVVEGDHITALNIYTSFIKMKDSRQHQWCYDNFLNYYCLKRAVNIREKLKGYMRKFNIPIVSAYGSKSNTSKSDSPTEVIRKCVMHGFFNQAAVKQPDNSYLTLRGQQKLYIHPSSILFKYPPKWVVYTEVIQTTKNYMRDVMAIEPEWLSEVAPHFYVNAVDAMVKKVDSSLASNVS